MLIQRYDLRDCSLLSSAVLQSALSEKIDIISLGAVICHLRLTGSCEKVHRVMKATLWEIVPSYSKVKTCNVQLNVTGREMNAQRLMLIILSDSADF